MVMPVLTKRKTAALVAALFWCVLPFMLCADPSAADESDGDAAEWNADATQDAAFIEADDDLLIAAEKYAGAPVADMAGILSRSEISGIAARLTDFSESVKTDAAVVLVPDTGIRTAEEYADDFFDYGRYGTGEDRDGILLLIVTGGESGGRREVYISTSGPRTIRTVTDSRVEDLLDALIDGGLAAGNYPAGIDAYIDELHAIIKSPEEAAAAKLKSSLLFALGTGVFVFLVSFLVLCKRYKIAGAKPYYNRAEQTTVHFDSTHDPLISTNTVSTVRPKNNNSGGSSGSSTHTSSSGRTHGGGGRSF